MKATGIVRRIDDLGRVVIPKEIRRTLRIRVGDPLEIFLDNDFIVFQKNSSLCDLVSLSLDIADVLYKTHKRPVIVCDTAKVVTAAGISAKGVVEKPITESLIDIIMTQKQYAHSSDSGQYLRAIVGDNRFVITGAPIATDMYTFGAIMFLSNDSDPAQSATEAEIKLIQFFAEYMSKQLQD